MHDMYICVYTCLYVYTYTGDTGGIFIDGWIDR